MKNLKGKWRYLILIIGIIILVPILIDYLILGNQIQSNATNGEWIGFFGSYLGSVIGGMITLFVMFKTLDENRKTERRKEKINYLNSIIDLCLEYIRSVEDELNIIALMKQAISHKNDEKIKEYYIDYFDKRGESVKLNNKITLLRNVRRKDLYYYDNDRITEIFNEITDIFKNLEEATKTSYKNRDSVEELEKEGKVASYKVSKLKSEVLEELEKMIEKNFEME